MSDSMSTRPPAPARKGYATPRLVMYGRVEQLTQGTGTHGSDAGAHRMRAKGRRVR